MSTDLAVPESHDIVIPDTGEIVSVEDAGALARALYGVRERIGYLHEARRDLEHGLVYHARQQGTKTMHLGATDVKVTGGREVEWDITVLIRLLDAGLPAERYADLVTEVVTHRVNAAVAKQIEASGNPAYARIIGEARREVERPWRVSVAAA